MVFSNRLIILTTTSLGILSALLVWDPLTGGGDDRLRKADVLMIDGGATGPESFAFDVGGGGPYTGISDGRILRWGGGGVGWVEYATPYGYLEECEGSRNPEKEHVCGRPLGLRFDERTGDLYVADAYLGLLVVGHGGGTASPLVGEAGGVALRFTNSVEVDQETGVVYFTDSSRRFQRRNFISSIITGDDTGRLLKYDPKTGQTSVLLDGLVFPNGLSLTKDGSSLLISETTTCRVLKYSLSGHPPAAPPEVFASLPGFPDNIRRSERGGYWVAIHMKRGKLLKFLLSMMPWTWVVFERFPNMFLRLQWFYSLLGRWRGHALALRLGEDGEVLEVLGGGGGGRLRFLSEVDERNGTLWIGSVMVPFVGVYKL